MGRMCALYGLRAVDVGKMPLHDRAQAQQALLGRVRRDREAFRDRGSGNPRSAPRSCGRGLY